MYCTIVVSKNKTIEYCESCFVDNSRYVPAGNNKSHVQLESAGGPVQSCTSLLTLTNDEGCRFNDLRLISSENL